MLFALILAHTVGAWAWFLLSAGLVILLVVATVKVMRRRRALLYAPDDGLDP